MKPILLAPLAAVLAVLLSALPAHAQWTASEVAKLNASVPKTQAEFGVSVAAEGDTVVVGAMREDSANGNNEVGAVYVFERDAGEPDAWGEVAVVAPSDPLQANRFGAAVGLDGDTLVVGDFAWDPQLIGAAHVFERDAGGPGAWGQVAMLLASDGANGDHLGASVGISGDTIVASAPNDSYGASSRPARPTCSSATRAASARGARPPS
jgi:hypothetical protein